ncbi:hypothetical protein [Candidatus Berkiella aquae]|uniref:Uncharacterized protein n=1 Tax=Candidatus Berkiella aquae TaxID=295108 RepID=A0A0Q9YUZ0_9GAMM|nr:hypothetical protein [Candidatus Berkiella aquae]MCS5711741.1 hypothetical protein [Candidatus Berkiella aquae]
MAINSLNKKSDNEITIPRILNSHQVRMLPYWCQHSLSYDLFENTLARLATKDILPHLKPHWIEIPLDEELALLDEDHVLEVSVPVLNLCDLLPNAFFSGPALVAKVIGFNGYVAKGHHRLIENYPLAEFVLVTDIVGNQYEILLNKDGKIELPKEGAGLFSIPAQITTIFSANQVKQGLGLEDCQAQGIEKNKLYLLAPAHTNQNFEMHICISHLSQNKRIVDTIRKVEVDYQELKLLPQQATTKIDQFNEKLSNILTVEIDLSFDKLIDYPIPYALNVVLQTEKEESSYGLKHPTSPELTSSNRGWMQHPLVSSVFTKYFGLSVATLNALARKTYSRYDLMNDYLKGDRFGFSEQRGYNNFLLRTDAFERFYTMLIEELVYQRLPQEFLSDRVTTDKLNEIAFNQIAVDFHDSVVLGQLQTEIAYGQYFHFYQMFSRSAQLKEQLNLFAEGEQPLPSVTVDVVPQVRIATLMTPDEGRVQQSILKDTKTSMALNSAYLAARIRQQPLNELAQKDKDAALGEDHPLPPSKTDAKSIHIWYNLPPRSR